MAPEETPTEKVTLSLVYRELGRIRDEFNGGLESLRDKIDEQSSCFVTQVQFNERGRRFDGDFEQVRHDVSTAKTEAEAAMGKAKTEADARMDETNSRIDVMGRDFGVVKEALAEARGKASQNSVNFATLLAVLGIVIGISDFIIRVVTK